MFLQSNLSVRNLYKSPLLGKSGALFPFSHSLLAEQKRDELAKKIETSQDSSTEEEDEFDVTIPLAQNLSPSKITDYFKPIKKVVKMASLDDENNENNDNSKQNNSSEAATTTAQVIQPPKENNFKAKPVLEQ